MSFECHAIDEREREREMRYKTAQYTSVMRWLLIVSIVKIDTEQPINLSHCND